MLNEGGFFYHYQRCAFYCGTLNCPGLLLPGTHTRDSRPVSCQRDINSNLSCFVSLLFFLVAACTADVGAFEILRRQSSFAVSADCES